MGGVYRLSHKTGTTSDNSMLEQKDVHVPSHSRPLCTSTPVPDCDSLEGSDCCCAVLRLLPDDFEIPIDLSFLKRLQTAPSSPVPEAQQRTDKDKKGDELAEVEEEEEEHELNDPDATLDLPLQDDDFDATMCLPPETDDPDVTLCLPPEGNDPDITLYLSAVSYGVLDDARFDCDLLEEDDKMEHDCDPDAARCYYDQVSHKSGAICDDFPTISNKETNKSSIHVPSHYLKLRTSTPVPDDKPLDATPVTIDDVSCVPETLCQDDRSPLVRNFEHVEKKGPTLVADDKPLDATPVTIDDVSCVPETSYEDDLSPIVRDLPDDDDEEAEKEGPTLAADERLQHLIFPTVTLVPLGDIFTSTLGQQFSSISHNTALEESATELDTYATRPPACVSVVSDAVADNATVYLPPVPVCRGRPTCQGRSSTRGG